MDETPDRSIQECVGCKVEHNKYWIRLTQRIKIQQFIDEFGFNGTTNKCSNTPAKPGSVLAVDKKNDETMDAEAHAWYQLIAGIKNHMAQWSRPDIENTQCEILQFLQGTTKLCVEAQE